MMIGVNHRKKQKRKRSKMKFTRLAELRKQNKLSVEDMADLIKLSKHAYKSYEVGEREPKLQSLVKLADFFGVTTDYIYNHSDYKYPINQKNKEIIDMNLCDEEIELLKSYRLLKPEMQRFFAESIQLALNQQTSPAPEKNYNE